MYSAVRFCIAQADQIHRICLRIPDLPSNTPATAPLNLLQQHEKPKSSSPLRANRFATNPVKDQAPGTYGVLGKPFHSPPFKFEGTGRSCGTPRHDPFVTHRCLRTKRHLAASLGGAAASAPSPCPPETCVCCSSCQKKHGGSSGARAARRVKAKLQHRAGRSGTQLTVPSLGPQPVLFVRLASVFEGVRPTIFGEGQIRKCPRWHT